MGTREIAHGPTAERVAANVKALRTERRMTLDELGAALARVGRPMQRSGLSKIETGDRRVDVDDLVALALALDVTPNRLLLPAAGDEPVPLTGNVGADWSQAWAWAVGDDPLDAGDKRRARVYGDAASARFRAENRPHDPPGTTTFGEMRDIADAGRLRGLTSSVTAALGDGLKPGLVRDYVNLITSPAILGLPAWLAELAAADDDETRG